MMSRAMVMPSTPLAERLRPKNLFDMIGQTHLLGAGKPLTQSIDQGHLASIIFWGPPGVGKTTLAQLLAAAVDRPFISLSAITAGVKDIRELGVSGFDMATPVVFIDEIHRFNKAQQDALLPLIEKGKITLIGATTENPSFELNRALLSRCQVYVLEPLNAEDMRTLLQRALTEDAALKTHAITLAEDDALLAYAGGDGRKLLNLLELVIATYAYENSLVINNTRVKQAAQQQMAAYDKSGEQHYDLVSAMIKSIRGSHPDAALYWMARMINGGEDPVFIARRLLIAASEDIGLANPNALLIAGECFRAVQAIGYPECRIILGQTVVYLATSAKSNATYLAIDAALAAAKQHGDLPVPLHLRNSPTDLMKELNYGVGYHYPHDYPHHFVTQQYMPDALNNATFYQPAHNAREQEIGQRMQFLWKTK